MQAVFTGNRTITQGTGPMPNTTCCHTKHLPQSGRVIGQLCPSGVPRGTEGCIREKADISRLIARLGLCLLGLPKITKPATTAAPQCKMAHHSHASDTEERHGQKTSTSADNNKTPISRFVTAVHFLPPTYVVSMSLPTVSAARQMQVQRNRTCRGVWHGKWGLCESLGGGLGARVFEGCINARQDMPNSVSQFSVVRGVDVP